MKNNITPEQSTMIDRFVNGLEGKTREIATAYIRIPNTADCQPEVMALYFRYKGKFDKVTDRVEKLRRKLGLHYTVLQSELLQRI